MSDCRAFFRGLQNIDWWGGEEENIAVLVLLITFADLFWDLCVRLLAQSEDFVRSYRVGGGTRYCAGSIWCWDLGVTWVNLGCMVRRTC